MSGQPIKCTVLVLTKNEADVVSRVVDSCSRFDQVIVIDSNSTDDTQINARAAGAEVINFTWDGAYPKKKEWSQSLPNIRNDWTLLLDADEYLTPELAEELDAAMRGGIANACDAPLEYFWCGRALRHGHRARKRVAMRLSATTWPHPDDLHISTMWEVEGHYQPTVSGAVHMCRSTLAHEDRDALYDYFGRHNRYSDWEAYLSGKETKNVAETRMSRGRYWTRVPMKPLVFFVYSYIAKAGFLDGERGFDFAMAQSFYYWQISAKRRELRWRVGHR